MSITTQDCPRVLDAEPKTRFALLALMKRAFAVWGQRRDLAGLDAARLKDLGLSHMDAKAEAARRIWDVPAGWRS